MINKKSIWFLTLFSLILVLSVYYVTMPSELLLTNDSNYTVKEEEKTNEEPTVEEQESSVLVALRVEAEDKLQADLEELKKVLNDSSASIEDKNSAYEKMKNLNVVRGEEEKIEGQILENYKLKSFVKIDNDQIRVVVDDKDHSTSLANNIMRTVQANYEAQKYISVKFQG